MAALFEIFPASTMPTSAARRSGAIVPSNSTLRSLTSRSTSPCTQLAIPLGLPGSAATAAS